MYPVPLPGMTPNHRLASRGEPLRLLAHRLEPVAGFDDFDHRQNRYPMARSICLAHHEGWQHGRPTRHRDPRERVAGRGLHREEIDENAVAYVEVERHSDHPVVAQQSDDLAAGALARHSEIPKTDTARLDCAVDERIAVGPLNDCDTIAIDRMCHR